MNTAVLFGEQAHLDQEAQTNSLEDLFVERKNSNRPEEDLASKLALDRFVRGFEYREIDGIWLSEDKLALTNMSLLLNARRLGNVNDQEYVIKIPGIFSAPSKKPGVPNELTTLAHLPSHPNIPEIIATGTISSAVETDRYPYFVMEKEKRGTLSDLLPIENPEGLRQALNLVAGATEAVIVAHEEGIVHLDIKPDNILNAGDTGKLTDWSSGDEIGAQPINILEIPVSVGFTSPEDAFGLVKYTYASDSHGIGRTLLRVISTLSPEDNLNLDGWADNVTSVIEVLRGYAELCAHKDSRKRRPPVEILEVLHKIIEKV
jgi:serine/threonine protein kinase